MPDLGSGGPQDALIVGGGPAGLSAALLLGRMGRTVTVIDGGRGRNHDAHAVRGFLAVDGLSPGEFRTVALRQIARYPAVQLCSGLATSAVAEDGGFAVGADGGARFTGRRLLLATGVSDVLPAVDGLAQAWGAGVYSCVYCHGWEARDRPLAVVGDDPEVLISFAFHLRNLSADIVVIVTAEPSVSQRAVARQLAVRIRVHEIVSIRSLGERDVEVRLADGSAERFAAVFIRTGKVPRSALAECLGCALSPDGRIRVNQFGHTSVPGVFAAGDVALSGIIASQVVSAAAGGAEAGIAIDQDLLMTGIERVRNQVEQDLAAKAPRSD